jgi:hypothetical protein
MDGEFIVEETLGIAKGIAGGNIIIQGATQTVTLAAARRAAESIAEAPGVITPFPAGVVRSGSKVGSRYKALRASTNDAFCPTLRGRVETQLVDGAQCAYEIVINGVDESRRAPAGGPSNQPAAREGKQAITPRPKRRQGAKRGKKGGESLCPRITRIYAKRRIAKPASLVPSLSYSLVFHSRPFASFAG